MPDQTHEDFLQQNPLSFGLYNYYERNDYNLLYINDNPDDLRFNLEIKNLSTEAINLRKSTQSDIEAPSSNNYHIELKFRPNQLSQRSREKIDLSEVSKDGWSMSRPYENRDRTVSLFLLKRKEDLVIEQQGTQFITLVGLGANSIEGARVTQLEINYKDFYLAQEKSDENANAQRNAIDPQRQIIILTVLNHSGERAASLTVTFAYAPTLLNTGSEFQSLLLQIVNVGQDVITLNEKSKFEITIDVEGNKEEAWALAKKDETEECEIFVGKNIEPSRKASKEGYWVIEKSDSTVEDPTWIIKPNFAWKREDEQARLKQFTLKQNEDLFITINKLKTSLRSGIGNLHIAYYNLPGYMDKKIILGVTKTCITEQKESGVGSGRIGINKLPDPETQLDVKGKIAADSLEVKGEVALDSLDVKGEVVANSLTVNNTVSARKFEGEGAFVTGMIMMWSGAADAVPYGWALCDGTKGTPDLRDRFIVGAGNTYPVNDVGEGDAHEHSLLSLNGEFSTNSAGRHNHRVGYHEYEVSSAGISGTSDVRKSNDWSEESSEHQHRVSVEFNNGKASQIGTLRPPWYALCFLMKIRMRDILATASETLTLKRGDKDIDWYTVTGYTLVFQKDGNLVLYNTKNSNKEVIWATGTNGTAETLTALKDGNFVLFNSKNESLWSTKTRGKNRLVLEENGNLVVYSQSNEILFQTETTNGTKKITEAAKAWKE